MRIGDHPMYDERVVMPMRQELTRLGIKEARTAEEVDAAVKEKGTVLVVVNSVCGCAAGMARPAVAMALEHDVKPDKAITVFAGNDREATARVREKYFVGYRPSSPAIALFRDGQLVKMVERWQIEGREAHDIATDLVAAFDQYCAKQPA